MIKFVRIRGKIIPIIEKAVAKGSGYFGRKSKMIAHDENIKAINAIRKTRMGKGELIGEGQELFARHARGTGKVVKEIRNYVPDFRIERRFLVENALSRIGHSPKGHLIKTSKKSYIVQDKVKTTAINAYEKIVERFPHLRGSAAGKHIGESIDKAHSKAKKRFGIDGIDDHWDNWGFSRGSNKAKLLDGGYASFDQWKGANGFGGSSKVIRYWPEKMARLMSRSKTIKMPDKESIEAKRKILEELKKKDKFNLLGKK